MIYEHNSNSIIHLLFDKTIQQQQRAGICCSWSLIKRWSETLLIEHTNYLITSIMTILNYNESIYLQENPDVAQAVASGLIPNGYVENSNITLVMGDRPLTIKSS